MSDWTDFPDPDPLVSTSAWLRGMAARVFEEGRLAGLAEADGEPTPNPYREAS